VLTCAGRRREVADPAVDQVQRALFDLDEDAADVLAEHA
jgi:hypothetical protein